MRTFTLLLFFTLIKSSLPAQHKDLIPYIEGKLFGYCDYNGAIVIKPAVKDASLFEYGYASVRIVTKNHKDNQERHKSIIIDTKGKMAFNDTFDLAWSFEPVLVEVKKGIYKEAVIARVKKGDDYFYIDRQGKKITQKINAIQEIKNHRTEQYITFPYELSIAMGRKVSYIREMRWLHLCMIM